MVLNSAFDISPFTDLVDTLYAMHALQTINGLMFNRAQVNKVQIMNYCSSLQVGYRPTPTGADVLHLMKDVRIFSFLMNIFTEQPLLPTSILLLQQVLDGLLRMVHHLPDHVQVDLHTSLQIFAACFKLKQTILAMAAWPYSSMQQQSSSLLYNLTMEFPHFPNLLPRRRTPTTTPVG